VGKNLIIVAGPNGAGKTTFVRDYLEQDPLAFLSADDLAAKISPDKPEAARIEAGREFSRQLRTRIEAGESFAIETTLSGRSLYNTLLQAKEVGYTISMVFVFLDSPEACLNRVRTRVLKGGHNVPDADVRRRFFRSKWNFCTTYRHTANTWFLFYNSFNTFEQVAFGDGTGCAITNDKLLAVFGLITKRTKNPEFETYRQAAELQRIGNRAVQKTQEENRRKGIPNAYSKDGVPYYELPNGELTRENPFTESPDQD
jgi:predicted ABC-type ATPase